MWDRLQIGLVLDELLGAAMQEADMRIEPIDHLAVHFHDQAQHAMGRGMLRPEIHRQRLDLHFAHGWRLWTPFMISESRLFRRLAADRKDVVLGKSVLVRV